MIGMTKQKAETTLYDAAHARRLYSLCGHLVYLEPCSELFELLSNDMPFLKQFESSDNLSINNGLALLSRWESEHVRANALQEVNDYRAEWTALFMGPATPLAPPWGSFYIDRYAMLFADSTLGVRQWYKRFDLELERKNREPDDHIGLMLIFLSHLADLESKAGESFDVADRLDKTQLAFTAECLDPWIRLWVGKVIEKGKLPLYMGVANLVLGYLEEKSHQESSIML